MRYLTSLIAVALFSLVAFGQQVTTTLHTTSRELAPNGEIWSEEATTLTHIRFESKSGWITEGGFSNNMKTDFKQTAAAAVGKVMSFGPVVVEGLVGFIRFDPPEKTRSQLMTYAVKMSREIGGEKRTVSPFVMLQGYYALEGGSKNGVFVSSGIEGERIYKNERAKLNYRASVLKNTCGLVQHFHSLDQWVIVGMKDGTISYLVSFSHGPGAANSLHM